VPALGLVGVVAPGITAGDVTLLPGVFVDTNAVAEAVNVDVVFGVARGEGTLLADVFVIGVVVLLAAGVA
jgi:hypothetical protein